MDNYYTNNYYFYLVNMNQIIAQIYPSKLLCIYKKPESTEQLWAIVCCIFTLFVLLLASMSAERVGNFNQRKCASL